MSKDENILREFNVEGGKLTCTNKRLFIQSRKGKKFQEIGYQHISSMKYEERFPWKTLIAGIILLVVGFYFTALLGMTPIYIPTLFSPLMIGLLIIIVGILLIILAIFRRFRGLTIYALGIEPANIRGQAYEILEIIKFVREL